MAVAGGAKPGIEMKVVDGALITGASAQRQGVVADVDLAVQRLLCGETVFVSVYGALHERVQRTVEATLTRAAPQTTPTVPIATDAAGGNAMTLAIQQLFANARAILPGEPLRCCISPGSDRAELVVMPPQPGLGWVMTLEATVGRRGYEHAVAATTWEGALAQLEAHVGEWLDKAPVIDAHS